MSVLTTLDGWGDANGDVGLGAQGGEDDDGIKIIAPGKSQCKGGDTFSVALGIDEKSQLGVFSSTGWASRRNQH